MKKIKHYPQQLLSVYLPIVIILAVAVIATPQLMVDALSLNYIFLLVALLFIFSPTGNILMGSKKTSFNEHVMTFIKISLLELLVTLIKFGSELTIWQQFPFINHDRSLSVAVLLQHNLNVFVLHVGLYPWTAIIVLAIAIVLLQQKSKIHINLLQALRPAFKTKLDGFIGAGCEIFLRQGLVFSMALFTALVGLSVYYYGAKLGFYSLKYGPTLANVIIFFVIFTTISSRFYQNFIRKLLKQNFTTGQFLLIHMLLITLALMLLNPILTLIAQSAQLNFDQRFHLPFLSNTVSTWHLFNWSWWLGIIIILVPQFVAFAEGKTIRFMLLSSLFWPFMIALGWSFSQDSPAFFGLLTGFLSQTWLLYSINLFAILCILIYLGYFKHFDKLLVSYLYRETSPSIRKYPLKILRNILQMVTLLMLLYLLAGLKIVMLMFFAMTGTCFAVFVVIIFGLVRAMLLRQDEYY